MENAKNIPILIYVTKAKPYLSKDAVAGGRYVLSDAKDYFNRGDLNGLVCFECECKEAFVITPDYDCGGDGYYWPNGLDFARTGLDPKGHFLEDYGKGRGFYLSVLYAYHFENVRAISPFPITQLYRDEACTKPLKRAPQSHCFAYRKIPWSGFFAPKVLVFSIRSPFVALEANIDPNTGKPLKDLELRKARISGAGIEYR